MVRPLVGLRPLPTFQSRLRPPPPSRLALPSWTTRFYFTYYDKYLSAPFDGKDFDRLHKFYLRPRHKMDRRCGKKTIPRRMCRNRHGSLYRILEDLRLRALR